MPTRRWLAARCAHGDLGRRFRNGRISIGVAGAGTGASSQTPFRTTPTGYAALDECLPGGGWPRGALTEILVDGSGMGEFRLALMAAFSRNREWIALIGPPHLPYPPALAHHGIDLSRVLLIRAPTEAENIWAAEQTLRSGVCAAITLWSSRLDPRSLRRLQLAAESANACAVLYRARSNARQTSPAALRLELEPSAGGLSIHILKCRGARPGRTVSLALE